MSRCRKNPIENEEMLVLDEYELEEYVLNNIIIGLKDNTINIVRKTLELEVQFMKMKGIMVDQ